MSIGLLLMGAERRVALALWTSAVVGCLLGLAVHPSALPDPGIALQLLDLVRVLTLVALAVVLVLGPGLMLRARIPSASYGIGFVMLPGLALLAATGLIAWLLGIAGWPHATVVSVVVLAPSLLWLLIEIATERERPLTSGPERRALMFAGAALLLGIARALWSLGPTGELFGGTVFRTLEVGDRSDPVISYHVAQLVVQGASPAGALSHSYFLPYAFSDRGPLAGLASVPLILLTGGRPPATLGNPPWLPFDPEGFMAYRIAMMVFATTAFLALWTLVRRVAGERAAQFAVLLAVTTPFLVHEVWFTWPKLLAATLVLLAAVEVLDRRPLRAGLLVSLGYLVHPLALLSIPALALIALWPIVGARLRRPRVGELVWLAVGIAAGLVAWRLINLSDYTQNGFTSYLSEAGRTHAYLTGHTGGVTIGAWLNDRLVSLGNTVVPLRLFFLSAQDQSVNSALQPCFPLCRGGSPAVVHFYFQYWTGVPFGMGIFFFPLLLVSLWRALRRWPWAIVSTVLIPLLAFVIYWGDASTGLLREGLQVWVLTLLAAVAIEQHAAGYPWLRHPLLRGVLAFRVVELLLVAILPTIATTGRIIAPLFALTDVVAVALLLVVTGLLIAAVWREPADVRDQPRGAPEGSLAGAGTRSVSLRR